MGNQIDPEEKNKLSSPIIELSRYLQEYACWIDPGEELPRWGFNQHLEAITHILGDIINSTVDMEYSREVLASCRDALKNCSQEIDALVMPVPGEAPGAAAEAVRQLDGVLIISGNSYLDGISALIQLIDTGDMKYADMAGDYFTRGALEMENAVVITEEMTKALELDLEVAEETSHLESENE